MPDGQLGERENGFCKKRRASYAAIIEKRRDVYAADKTEYVLGEIYGIVTTALNQNRKAFKKMYFGRVGYLNLKWSYCGFTEVEQDTMGVWLKRYSVRDYLRPEDIPSAKTFRNDGNQDVENEMIFLSCLRTGPNLC